MLFLAFHNTGLIGYSCGILRKLELRRLRIGNHYVSQGGVLHEKPLSGLSVTVDRLGIWNVWGIMDFLVLSDIITKELIAVRRN